MRGDVGMKFLMLIISEEYQRLITEIFAHHKCDATIISSTGDFLEYGEIIYLLGIEEKKSKIVLDEIEEVVKNESRVRNIASSSDEQEEHMRIVAYNLGLTKFMKIGGGEVKHDQQVSEGAKF